MGDSLATWWAVSPQAAQHPSNTEVATRSSLSFLFKAYAQAAFQGT